ncbi:lysozyme c-1-like [Phlebotomus argentipes]|uniref:lysozyme c-1-like n=1 Tax=Phlebotomus argentipes TaxID=94469 RepID=UPI0028933599|nr:lysozyme c-1-like [Phlebotomus argentipes]
MRLSVLKITCLALFGALLITSASAKIFTRCQLAKELARHKFPRSFISNWVCLIENESGRSTTKVTQHPNLTTSYGLFQINSKDWCRKGRKAGECNMKCEDFLNDDVTDDIRCARLMYDRHGFLGWPGWKNKCKGRSLPDVSRC